MVCFASERAYRYVGYNVEMGMLPERFIKDGAFYERSPSDDRTYPMDKVLDGLMEMHHADLRRNILGIGPGCLIDSMIEQMLMMVRYVRCQDEDSFNHKYDDLICMDDAYIFVLKARGFFDE